MECQGWVSTFTSMKYFFCSADVFARRLAFAVFGTLPAAVACSTQVAVCERFGGYGQKTLETNGQGSLDMLGSGYDNP